jgi:hypothetical protein
LNLSQNGRQQGRTASWLRARLASVASSSAASAASYGHRAEAIDQRGLTLRMAFSARSQRLHYITS